MKDWRSLGALHRRRDEAAGSIAQAQGAVDDARTTTSLARWPGIVQAIRRVVAAYNEGAGRDVLVVTEAIDGQPPAVTIEASAGTPPALVLTLDGAEVNVGSGLADSSTGAKRWVDLTRTDDETAAYVLEEWLERL
jgi:hypothetical protein